LAQHGLDWPADVLRLQSPADSQQSDSLTLAFDDGNLPRKQAAAALLRQASQTPTEDLTKLFERAIELDPENALAHNNLAWRLATTTTEVGETAEALVHARRAVELDNQRHSYLNTLGVALYRAGELDEAIDALKKSLAGSTPSDSEYDLIFLALCCAQQGDWAAAQEFYSRAASVHQEHLLRRTPAVREELDRFLAEARAAGLQ
jgi:tetratricopeptide (TPR) repeat protein